jgi:hypothetical protein
MPDWMSRASCRERSKMSRVLTLDKRASNFSMLKKGD